MNPIAALRLWWKAMTDRSRVGCEVEEEFKFHVDAYVADLIRQDAVISMNEGGQ